MKRIDRARKHHLRVAHQPKRHQWYIQLRVLINLYNNQFSVPLNTTEK